MTLFHGLALISIHIFLSISYGDCPYPAQFPSPENYHEVDIGIYSVGGAGPSLSGFETPIVARIGLAASGRNQWNCMATYSHNILSLDTPGRPLLSPSIPSDLYTTNNRLLCYTYSYIPFIKYITGSYSTVLSTFYENIWGLRSLDEIIEMQTKVESCGDPNDITNKACLDTVASEYNYCGDIMGVIVAVSTNYILSNDGYNDDGSETPFGECTANCRPFSDPIGFYDPRIDIFKKKNSDYKLKDFPGFSKLNKFEWANLLEDDDKGFFYRQEHVTPHIGYTVDPITFSKKKYKSLTKLIGDPKYDYKLESELVIQRFAETATNVTKKAIIEVMNDKVNVGILIQLSHRAFFNPTYEQNVIFDTGNKLCEYQGSLLSWREKIKYNLIRPTTIIQSSEYTDDYITTYGGPFQGVQTIKTQDFHPYIRVMPHAEYPSGSGCICRMLYDHIDAYIQNEYGAPSLPINFVWLPFGTTSKIEPGNGAENVQFLFSNAQEMYEICAESRLWGGMHFTDSIEASDELCKDIGDGIYDYLQGLLNGGDERGRRRGLASNTENTPDQAKVYFDEYIDIYKQDLEIFTGDVI